jgi:uncharacterized protein
MIGAMLKAEATVTHSLLTPSYTTDERRWILQLARQSVEAAAASLPVPAITIDALPQALCELRACFVTLHKHDALRGCTGVLMARSPLALEVTHSAAQSALYDPRFNAVAPDEVPHLHIEISILTPPVRLSISSPPDIQCVIRPGIDGVTLTRGMRRATFLPQVWERVSEPSMFLDMLCQKMGLPRRAWLYTPMEVETYQAEEVSETEFAI